MIERTVVEERGKNVVLMDVFSKLAQNRILFIDDVIDSKLANGIVSQLLYLDSINNDQINIYINSPGGSVYDGFAIIDTMNIIKSPIKTICVGIAASMAAVILLNGDKRAMTEHSTTMLHQPSGGIMDKLSDMIITVKEIERVQDILYKFITSKTKINNPKEILLSDKWMGSEEAKKLGIIDEIIYGKPLC